MWTFLARIGASLLNKVLPDRSGVNQAQARVNEAEVAGAPPSILRLWRCFLGWTCSLLFAWEVESARENLPTIGEKNSPEQIPCFVQCHYTKRRVAPPFFPLPSPSLHPLYMVAPAAVVVC